MILVIDLIVGAHEPYTGVIAVSFCCVTVIPLTVEFNQKPIVDISVISRITVNSHVRDSSLIEEHLAACVVNVAVTASFCKSSVCGMLVIRCSGQESEPQIIVYPVEDRSGCLNIAASSES